MAAKHPRKPPLTDDERHDRFKEMAREVGASEKPEDFDRAFADVAKSKDAQKRDN